MTLDVFDTEALPVGTVGGGLINGLHNIGQHYTGDYEDLLSHFHGLRTFPLKKLLVFQTAA